MSTDLESMDQTTVLYVDACVEKWMPFVKDVDPSRHGRLSYLCERETRYWKANLREDGSPVKNVDIGAKLKYVFPTLKKLDERLPRGETDFDQIYETTNAAFEDILPEPVWCIWGMRDNRPSAEETKGLLGPLVERTHAVLVDYEKIVKN